MIVVYSGFRGSMALAPQGVDLRKRGDQTDGTTEVWVFQMAIYPKNPWALHGRGRTRHLRRGPDPQNPICLRARILRVLSIRCIPNQCITCGSADCTHGSQSCCPCGSLKKGRSARSKSGLRSNRNGEKSVNTKSPNPQ